MAGERILIVEDDPDARQLLGMILNAEGFCVAAAPDGEAALGEIARQPPDLILLDLMLPRMDGWEVCERLRRLTTAPVIMVTARTSVPDKVRGLAVGADDYVEKPYDPQELLARVRAHLRRARDWSRSSPAPRPPLAVGTLQLDPASYEVRLDARPVVVTRLEFELLYCLAHHAGRALSRRELIDRVWGADEQIDPRGIDAHIRHLRAKIEDDPGAPRRIQTVHGVGYKLASTDPP
jgi:two-component system response regulator RegX3